VIQDFVARLLHGDRNANPRPVTDDDLDAFIDSRSLEYASRLEDAFVERALKLGVENGVVLDVGTRVGLIPLKILWQNEGFLSIGIDASTAMIDRARETAAAWGLQDRAFFQVGDARRMRLKSGYFDLIVSDGVFHAFNDPVSVLSEIGRVLKPKGGLLIRDLGRPNRFKMSREIDQRTGKLGPRMRPQIENALRSAYTAAELQRLLNASGIAGARVTRWDDGQIGIEREGTTDPNSWVSVREQYR
jgi:ubiquinone/menaquinone biosynthesis C-methylase UbiE